MPMTRPRPRRSATPPETGDRVPGRGKNPRPDHETGESGGYNRTITDILPTEVRHW